MLLALGRAFSTEAVFDEMTEGHMSSLEYLMAIKSCADVDDVTVAEAHYDKMKSPTNDTPLCWLAGVPKYLELMVSVRKIIASAKKSSSSRLCVIQARTAVDAVASHQIPAAFVSLQHTQNARKAGETLVSASKYVRTLGEGHDDVVAYSAKVFVFPSF